MTKEEKTTEQILYDIVTFLNTYVHEITDYSGKSLKEDFRDIMKEATDRCNSWGFFE